MKEFEIFETYLQILNEINELEAELHFYPENADLKRKIESIESQRVNLKNQLENIEEKSFSKDAHQRMIKQLIQFISELDSVDPQLRVDRNQGLVIEDYVFSKVYHYLDVQIKFPVGGIFLHLLYYAYEQTNSISKADFKKFIQSEIDTLSSIESVNYVSLMEFMNTYFERVKKSGLFRIKG
ncbi:MAG: hypothetical protein IPO03_05215 [Bacteroidetes bacterium]|nr:hypothetical protein [Bacteroidota bacterium]